MYPLTLQTIYLDFGLVASEGNAEVLDEELHKCLEHGDEYPLSAFSIDEKSDVIGDHCQLVNCAVTRMALNDIPGVLLKMDSHLSCTLVKAQSLLLKTGHTHMTTLIHGDLIHGDLVGPMLVGIVSHCKYGFVWMDDYSCTSWVLLLRVKSNAPTVFQGHCDKIVVQIRRSHFRYEVTTPIYSR